ncbi:hypothetical protein [Rhodococcus sovatensis]|uniref:Uncharacterized protein n=1 Tax=Rhodococcus sovatensis TaxID=1805840 RepID=A0ABZ2PQD5_9NOCA
MSPADRARGAASLADTVRRRHPERVQRIRGVIERQVASDLELDERIAPGEHLQGTALQAGPDTTVAVGHSFYPHTSDLGTFPSDAAPHLMRIKVGGFDSPHIRSLAHASTPITSIEAEGWMRAALGDEWADYAYRVDYRNKVDFDAPATMFRFAVVVDRSGTALLAPTDFDWARVDLNDARTVRKVEPVAPNHTLSAHLAEHGSFVDAASYRPPGIDSDGRWELAVTTVNPNPGSMPAFAALGTALCIRGNVDTGFIPEALDLTGTTGTLQYRRRGRDGIFHRTFPIPDAEPIAGELSPNHERSWSYPAMVTPTTPVQWASGLIPHWREMFAYGPL